MDIFSISIHPIQTDMDDLDFLIKPTLFPHFIKRTFAEYHPQKPHRIITPDLQMLRNIAAS
jgi:hypothetical protein